jgi:elongation factor Ts
MVEVVCETDFCARNDEFKAMVKQVVGLAAKQPAGAIEPTAEMTAAVQACFAKIGENMRYSRGVKISAPRLATYLHHNNKVGVVLGVEGDAADELLSGVCQHIAFADPMAVSTDQIPADVVAHERKIASEQAAESGKPPAIVEKMITGKVQKFLAANALLEQPFVRDETKKVKEVLGATTIKAFARFQIG